MTKAIDDVIANAEAKAATAAAATTAVTTQPAASMPARAPARGPALKMADVIGQGLMPDFWVKVNEYGITVGNDRTLHSELEIEIDVKRVAPVLVVKFGNPATYLKSYDGVSCVQGGSWADAQMRAAQADSRAREYRSVDLPMTLVDAITKGKEILVPAGAYLGHSTATTNWRNWESFYTTLLERGLENSIVRVKLGFEPMTNKAGNTWGVLTFTLLGAAEEFADAA